jgi:hypothetical protein
VTIWSGYRLRFSLGRPRGAPLRRRVWLAAAAAAAIGLVAVPAIPASAAGGPGNLSVSVSVVPPVVKSVTLSVSSTSYVNCVYGTSTATQLGFPNGACQAASQPIVVTNGTAPATITVNGANMVPADLGPNWTLAGSAGPAPSCPATGPDQYCETLAPVSGYDSGASLTPAPYLVLGNAATCDTVFSPACGPASPGQAAPEFLAMTGPSSSTDTSSSFSTAVTWTAS